MMEMESVFETLIDLNITWLSVSEDFILSFVDSRLQFIVILNLLTPNVNYSGRTAPLTSKVAFYIFIQQIYVLNILNMVYTLRFFLFKVQFVS